MSKSATTHIPQARLISRKEVRIRTGDVSEMTQWRREKSPDYPPKITICGSVFFDEGAIDQYIISKTERKDLVVEG